MDVNAPGRPLPVESLLPYPVSSKPEPQQAPLGPPQGQRTQSLDALRDALQQAQREAENDSQGDDDNAEVGEDGKPTKRPKRARACIACRNMKIRCLPVDGQEACLACSKVNRECVMPGPARKRQKTVHKVAELEKKINMLTDALIAKTGTGPTPPGESPANDRSMESQSDITRSDTDPKSPPTRTTSTRSATDPAFNRHNPMLGKNDLDWGCSRFVAKEVNEPVYIDAIERGLLSLEDATAMFDHYIANMLPYFPVLSFPSYVKAADVRVARPTLFLAIITAACAGIRPDLHSGLNTELSRQLSERLLFSGEKSFELVQALLVATAYYVRARYAKDLVFNQYIHSAVVMCLDLGMGRRYPKHLKADKDGIEEAEVRRTWLGCYYFASSVSILMRHPSLVRWTPYIEDCLQYFATSPNTLPGDAWLCALVRCQHIAEDVCTAFGMDDPSASISFTDTRTQYHLKAFEKQLADWRASAPGYIDKRLVEHVASSTNLYIHEIAIHHEHNLDDFKPDPNITEEKPATGSFITNIHVDALTTCLDSCHRVLNSYLALDARTARLLPNLLVVWNTYACVSLIKLDSALRAPDSAFGHIFTPDIKVDHYLTSVIQKLSEVGSEGRHPPSEAFIFVTKKLTSWHMHKKAPWVGDDGNTQMPDTQHPHATGLSFRSAEENREQDAFTSKSMKDKMSIMMKLPEDYRNRGTFQTTVNEAADAMAKGVNMSQAVNPQNQFNAMASQTSDLNAAFDAANYNLNWGDMNFSQDELNVFDSYMNDQGWMGYLI